MPNKSGDSPGFFDEGGLKRTIDLLKDEIRELYLEDNAPWIVGYSGGKDSTAVLQLVWAAIEELPKNKRSKKVHVISTDTLVENPVVVNWVMRSLDTMKKAAETEGLPIAAHRLTPDKKDTFWVNLIGRGYPAPRRKFRWCTERLKIEPSNKFIKNLTRKHGSAILVLGIRKAESSKRTAVMNRLEKQRVRDRLSPNANLPNCQVYSPIEKWTNDAVWTFLMQFKNPWGYDNKQLLTMYQGASPDGECPLVVDTSTPSCGSSRFGCWVCTMVDEDRSMQAMIRNDAEKEWMMPLLDLRNELGDLNDRERRDFRRMHGNVQLFHDEPIPGPYLQHVREHWLKRVLEARMLARENAPPEAGELDFISLDELREIRRIWVEEKHEMEDSLPRIYKDVTGEEFPDGRLDDGQVFGMEEINLLREICGEKDLHFELVRELLHVEWMYRSRVRRAGLYERLEKAFKRGFYDDAEDAEARALRKENTINKKIAEIKKEQPFLL